MRRWIALSAAFVTILSASSIAHADELSDCLLNYTSPHDRLILIKWIFSAASMHPAVKTMTSLTPAQHEEINREAAHLLERLMTADCRKETVYAIKYQGTNAIQKAFGTLGETAMTGLMSDPGVKSGLEIAQYLDVSKFKELGQEAGQLSK